MSEMNKIDGLIFKIMFVFILERLNFLCAHKLTGPLKL